MRVRTSRARPTGRLGRTTFFAALWLIAVGAVFGLAAESESERVQAALPVLPRAQAEVQGDRPAAWVVREQLLMGTRLRVQVAAPDRALGLDHIDDVFSSVSQYENLLSSWDTTSEISALNRAPPGQEVVLSCGLADLLSEVIGWSEETGGAFEPRVGALVDSWGIRRSAPAPTAWNLEVALLSVGSGSVVLDPISRRASRRSPTAWIDAGAFGKGAALRAAAARLRARGVRHAFLDFGGQILAVGSGDRHGPGWSVSVAHPEHRLEPATTLRVTDVSVATSGTSAHRIGLDGHEVSHIIDPRTGQPVRPWGSVTVVSEDPLTADVVATALYVLGSEEGLEWAEDRSDFGVLFSILEADGRLRWSWNPRMEAWLDSNPADLEGPWALPSRDPTDATR